MGWEEGAVDGATFSRTNIVVFHHFRRGCSLYYVL